MGVTRNELTSISLGSVLERIGLTLRLNALARPVEKFRQKFKKILSQFFLPKMFRPPFDQRRTFLGAADIFGFKNFQSQVSNFPRNDGGSNHFILEAIYIPILEETIEY